MPTSGKKDRSVNTDSGWHLLSYQKEEKNENKNKNHYSI
jgi:hypothetical protein